MSSETVLEVLVVAAFGFGIYKMWQRETGADPTWATVMADPLVRLYSGVRVQINPGMLNSSLLKAGVIGNELAVRTHSFNIGPAVRGRRAFSYCFVGSETQMTASHEAFGVFRDRDCIVISGTYGGKPIHMALSLDGQLANMWEALIVCGVHPLSQPPSD